MLPDLFEQMNDLKTRIANLERFGASAGSTSFVTNETPTGLVNGSNTAFDTANSYVTGSIMVYRDGQLMTGGGADYTETDSNTITFVTAPVTGSVIKVSYQQAVSTSGNADTLDGEHVIGIIDLIYPVGSIYISTVGTNPGTLFGIGTWVAFGTGRTLVGIDSTQTEFDVVEETGGAKTHTLQLTEVPAHTHTVMTVLNHSDGTQVTGEYINASLAYGTARRRYSNYEESRGGGLAHNNLQPYIVTYMWKRTA
jgi:hypothetical protein